MLPVFHMKRAAFPLNQSDFVDTAISIILGVHGVVARKTGLNPYRAFTPLETKGHNSKMLLGVDYAAESEAADMLKAKMPELLTLGEESLANKSLDLTGERRYVVLMDMVDGTDLLERGLSNWCSAMIFFYPPERKILGAFIGFPGVGVYFATEKLSPQFRSFDAGARSRPVLPPDPDPNLHERFHWATSLKDASIAYYGQKHGSFAEVADRTGFISSMKDMKDGSDLRIYNLAGNPMMMRLIDGYKRIDAVFDVRGQHPHDVAPGAYIASKVPGVTFTDLEGGKIDLVESLMHPADDRHKLRYVLAGSASLAAELRDAINRVPTTRSAHIVEAQNS